MSCPVGVCHFSDRPSSLALARREGWRRSRPQDYGMARHGIIKRIFWWRITAKDCWRMLETRR